MWKKKSLMLACRMLLTKNFTSWIFKILLILQNKGTITSSTMSRKIPEISALVVIIYLKKCSDLQTKYIEYFTINTKNVISSRSSTYFSNRKLKFKIDE